MTTGAQARRQAQEHLAACADAYRRRNTYRPSSVRVYQYWAEVLRVVDADTVELQVSLGFGTSVAQRFRLLGVDAPEIFSVPHGSAEHDAGMEAVAFVEDRMPPGTWVEVEVYSGAREKYGRWLCQVFVEGRSLNADLLTEGLAEPLRI